MCSKLYCANSICVMVSFLLVIIPPPQKKWENNFLGNYHVKFGHLLSFKHKFSGKNILPPKLSELQRLWILLQSPYRASAPDPAGELRPRASVPTLHSNPHYNATGVTHRRR